MAKVLIVDDDPQLLCVMTELMEAFGHCVVTANNGLEALNCMADGMLPDLVLTDLIMPIMNGRELIVAIRNLPATARVPVVLVTAATPELETFPPDDSYSAVLSKPFDVGRLLAVAARALEANGQSISSSYVGSCFGTDGHSEVS